MPTKPGDNNILKILDAVSQRKQAEHAFQMAIVKAQVEAGIKQREESAKIQEQMRANIQENASKAGFDKPEQFTPEQQYLKRRFMEESPLSQVMVPEAGSASQGQTDQSAPVGVSFPKDEITRDAKSGLYAQQPVDPDRQSQLLLEKISQMQAQGKTIHPAILKLADIARQNLVNKSQQSADLKVNTQQDRVEKTYTDRLLKEASNRSGGLGLQDAKVNQAIHLRGIANQYKDPKTGNYNVPQAQFGEMLIGLANLVSNNNVSTVEQLKSITPQTFAGDMAHLAAYWTGKPVVGNTQEMIKNIVDSVDRQGVISEGLRNKYFDDFNRLAPTGLDPQRLKQLQKVHLGNSYQAYMDTGDPRITTDNFTSDNAGESSSGNKTVVRTGTLGNQKVVQYSDGSTEYAAA